MVRFLPPTDLASRTVKDFENRSHLKVYPFPCFFLKPLENFYRFHAGHRGLPIATTTTCSGVGLKSFLLTNERSNSRSQSRLLKPRDSFQVGLIRPPILLNSHHSILSTSLPYYSIHHSPQLTFASSKPLKTFFTAISFQRIFFGHASATMKPETATMKSIPPIPTSSSAKSEGVGSCSKSTAASKNLPWLWKDCANLAERDRIDIKQQAVLDGLRLAEKISCILKNQKDGENQILGAEELGDWTEQFGRFMTNLPIL